jgi:hypothetical protein
LFGAEYGIFNVISQVNHLSYVTPTNGSSYAITALAKKLQLIILSVWHARAAT